MSSRRGSAHGGAMWLEAGPPPRNRSAWQLSPALIALLVAVNVILVVTDVAELSLQCALAARRIGGVSCCRSLAATTNVFIQPGSVTGDVGAHRIHPRVIAAK